MSKFGEAIINLRTQKKLTTKEVSQAISIPQSRYSELEKGVRIPTENQIKRMAEYFKANEDELASLLNKN